ncbi:MAG: polysaccharide deacetylase family protein [Actinomycetales bacterium]
MTQQDSSRLPRRTVLGLAGLGAAALSSCSPGSSTRAGKETQPPGETPAYGSPTADPSPASTSATGPANGSDITHGPRTSQEVALTFHGAGDPLLVDRLIALTRAQASHVTVLAVGQWAAANPDVLPRLVDAGHEVGNHTWSHRTMTRLSQGQLQHETDRAASELKRQVGDVGAWFRPSGTPRSTPMIRAAAQRAGYPRCLAYDVDSLDYTDPGPTAIVRTVSARVRRGSIVSLHLGHAGTMTALPALLDMLRRRGLRAVTAGELLAGS